MNDNAPYVLPLRESRDVAVVGGKAANLARLMAGGFKVPDGFVVTTHAYRRARQEDDTRIPADIADAVKDAYRSLGSPVVAVRSSATAEDATNASMAGQYTTFLDVQGEQRVLKAIGDCWAGADIERVRAYLDNRQVNISEVDMAVVVQMLVPADVAGVLFTSNPRTGSETEMMIEASWGLGESVVSGLVQPDVVVVDITTGDVIESIINDKRTYIGPKSHKQEAVPDSKRKVPCLSTMNIAELYEMGRRLKQHFGMHQDAEWAIHDDHLYVLQSRAITTLADTQLLRQCIEQTRRRVRRAFERGRGPWVLHNIAETLPHPTPLTWSVINRFMSGSGGFGKMYRRIGFEPSEVADCEGFLDLIGGRIYMDLSRTPEMFFAGFPFAYDIDLIRSNPDAAQGPPTKPVGSLYRRYRVGKKISRINKNLKSLAQTCDQDLRERIMPEFIESVRDAKNRDLTPLSPEELLDAWKRREAHVLNGFAPDAFLPSLICAMAIEELRIFVCEHFWQENLTELVNMLAVSKEPDTTVRANQGLFEIASGERSVEQWIKQYGHRAAQEYDLASPRWRECPDAVRSMATRLGQGTSPFEMHAKRLAQAEERIRDLRRRLPHRHRHEFDHRTSMVCRYLPFREDAKNVLMMGYELLRTTALEVGRRLGIDDSVFYLSLDEMQQAITAQRVPEEMLIVSRDAHDIQKRLYIPNIITQDSVTSLGEASALTSEKRLSAFGLSAGTCKGRARVLLSPAEAGRTDSPYILVCPSTDPAWTPLFMRASGLIMECGGTLSHGAVVAREIGIPAVVLPDGTNILRDGEEIIVDGTNGTVLREERAEHSLSADPKDTLIAPQLVPPPIGPRERTCGRLRNIALLVWTVYLVAVFLLPRPWLYESSMAVFDTILWPVAITLGKPATVALAAVVFALITMVGQRLLTDNRRLLAAKRRADDLRRRASKLPQDSPRRAALNRAASGVPGRVLAAGFVSMALILGPMVMMFIWFRERMDPAAWNPAPGTPVSVIATIDGEFLKEITLKPDPNLILEASTSASQSPPPIRSTLEDFAAKLTEPNASIPTFLASYAEDRDALNRSLQDYLSRPIPPQNLSWTLRTPEQKPGRYRVTIEPTDSKPVKLWATLGSEYPPGPRTVTAPSKSPIWSVRLAYQEQKLMGGNTFWAPFEPLGWSTWDAGWLLTYLAVYMPAIFIFRRLLHIP